MRPAGAAPFCHVSPFAEGGTSRADTLVGAPVSPPPWTADGGTSGAFGSVEGSGRWSPVWSGGTPKPDAEGAPMPLCILYLEQAAHEAERAIEDPQRWFFAVPVVLRAADWPAHRESRIEGATP